MQFIPHDDHFLIVSILEVLFPDMLGWSPPVRSRPEVKRDRKSRTRYNLYLTRMVDSISEVYRCIKMLLGRRQLEGHRHGRLHRGLQARQEPWRLDTGLPVREGSRTQHSGHRHRDARIYRLGPNKTKEKLASLQAGPVQVPARGAVARASSSSRRRSIENLQRQIATPYSGYPASRTPERRPSNPDERIKRPRNHAEAVGTGTRSSPAGSPHGRYSVRSYRTKDYDGARLVMEAINLQDPPIIADPTIGEYADANSEATHQSVQNALASTGALGGGPGAPVTPPPQQGMPTGPSQPNESTTR